uniref:Uncharacterized protein n=1 Tax=Anguilla anguilla TaxID=7936 RepID=A0A0E9WNE6_ANGAN
MSPRPEELLPGSAPLLLSSHGKLGSNGCSVPLLSPSA